MDLGLVWFYDPFADRPFFHRSDRQSAPLVSSAFHWDEFPAFRICQADCGNYTQLVFREAPPVSRSLEHSVLWNDYCCHPVPFNLETTRFRLSSSPFSHHTRDVLFWGPQSPHCAHDELDGRHCACICS